MLKVYKYFITKKNGKLVVQKRTLTMIKKLKLIYGKKLISLYSLAKDNTRVHKIEYLKGIFTKNRDYLIGHIEGIEQEKFNVIQKGLA